MLKLSDETTKKLLLFLLEKSVQQKESHIAGNDTTFIAE
jgi:hypothetical protein